MSKKIVITGGCGFIGAHFVEHFLKNTDYDIVIFDKLTYASSGLDRIKDINVFDDKRVFFYSVDISSPISEGIIKETKDANYISHLAANSHVDRSIEDPISFIKSNVLGTGYMLEYARQLKNLEAFHYMGTDESNGPAPFGVSYKEWDRYDSTNPYSATKSGGEELCLAYANTYKLPIFITKTMNVYGEKQDKEKFIPLVINKVLNDDTLAIHSDPTKTISGTRHWIHARNVADAVLFLYKNFKQRDKYNIVGEEISNLELAKMIASIIGKELKYEMVDFHSSRPGHDLRYSLDGTKMKQMGWEPPKDVYESLKKVINWTLENPKWLV